jgi:hypothetical protein
MKKNFQNIPVLILGYNRHTHIKKLINALRKIKPKYIYISLDGSKKKSNDKVDCELVKQEVKKINWDCSIKKKYNIKNLGCRDSVRKAISWFFKFNKFGIILEDDCIPNKSFFYYCQQINKSYANNEKIYAISGSNFYNKKTKYDYFYSKYNHCWGWATWKRAWKYYDNNLTSLNKFTRSYQWKLLHENKTERRFWEKIFNRVKEKKIDSWAYVWTYSVWKKNALTIIPKKNLIKNIGFDISATNSIKNEKKHLKAYSTVFNKTLKRPPILTPWKSNDIYVFNNHFCGKYSLWPWIIIKVLKLVIFNPKIFIIKTKRALLF